MMKLNKPRLQAIVAEKDEPQFVCNLSWEEVETLTEKQMEKIARDWCGKQGFTFVEYTEG